MHLNPITFLPLLLLKESEDPKRNSCRAWSFVSVRVMAPELQSNGESVVTIKFGNKLPSSTETTPIYIIAQIR